MSKPAKLKTLSYTEALKLELEGRPNPKQSEIGTTFISLCGGMKRFVEILHKEFVASPPGSTARAKTLATVLQTLKTKDDEYTSESLQGLDDEDVERLLQTTVSRAIELGVIRVNPAAEGEQAQQKEDGEEACPAPGTPVG